MSSERLEWEQFLARYRRDYELPASRTGIPCDDALLLGKSRDPSGRGWGRRGDDPP